MKQRATTIIGGILLVTGCLTGLYLIVATANAYIKGVFSTIVTDAPSSQLTSLNCPLLMGNNETGQVSASITNPTTDRIEYSVQIATSGLKVDAPASRQELTLSGNQTNTLVWKVTAVTAGNQAIVVQATSAQDLALPGPFHNWPTSFREGCGILVIDAPLTGAQMAGLGGTSILAGIALIFPWLSRKLRRGKARENAGVA